MAKRARKAAKPLKLRRRAKEPSSALQSVRPKTHKRRPGKRQSHKPKSETVELRELLRAAVDRQAATAEILKVIASSPSDVKPVLDAIVKTAAYLCGADFAFVYKFDGDMFHLA